MGTKTVKFSIDTHVRKQTASPLQTKYHYINVELSHFCCLLHVVFILSPLTPLDYCLWDHVKSMAYETPLEPEEHVQARVMVTAFVELLVVVIVYTKTWYIGTVYVLKSLVATSSPSCKWT